MGALMVYSWPGHQLPVQSCQLPKLPAHGPAAEWTAWPRLLAVMSLAQMRAGGVDKPAGRLHVVNAKALALRQATPR